MGVPDQDVVLAGGAHMRRRCTYPKSAAVAAEPRWDGREGALRSQLTISPRRHCHIRCAHAREH